MQDPLSVPQSSPSLFSSKAALPDQAFVGVPTLLQHLLPFSVATLWHIHKAHPQRDPVSPWLSLQVTPSKAKS